MLRHEYYDTKKRKKNICYINNIINYKKKKYDYIKCSYFDLYFATRRKSVSNNK